MDFPKFERKILKLWEKEKTFERTLKARAKAPRFVFFEGPPTANGRPGIHHILVRAYKDAVCRYKTMRGFLVERRAGWDTHGLPVEIEVEKELGLKTKSDVERYGIGRFNARSKKSVWRYKDEWEKLTKRIGFWIDLKNPYITYTNDYIETLWWIFKEIWKKGLLYENHKVVPWCTRCESTLSSHEVAQGYESVTENSVFVKFKVKGEKDTYILAWTTTPWTLPGNVALAVGADTVYVKAQYPEEGEVYILAKAVAEKTLVYDTNRTGRGLVILKEIKGKELIGLEYEPLFDVSETKNENSHKVYAADFVTTEEGTGVVHTAAMYGEDDYQLGIRVGLPKIHTVSEQGTFLSFVPAGLAGRPVKDKETEKSILSYLKEQNLLFREQPYMHDYPFCWRCKTPLLYYAKKSWFIKMSSVKQELIAQNQKIRWVPDYLKDGRFGEWLREVKDWAISRERFWGTPLPIWRCEACGTIDVLGSLKDLRNRTRLNNRYFLVRHGESSSNVGGWISSWPERRPNPLTRKGKAQIERLSKKLSKKSIDLIVTSPMQRTKQTAALIAKALKVEVAVDARLQDMNVSTFNTRPLKEYDAFLGQDPKAHWVKKPIGGENWNDLRKRMIGFLRDLERRYSGKTILLVSHGDPLFLLQGTVLGITEEEFIRPLLNAYPSKSLMPEGYPESPIRYPKNAIAEHLPNVALPLDREGHFDLHRPYVDEITIRCPKCKHNMHRVPEVLDVWFDSGAMPFAQWHYPFQNRNFIDSGNVKDQMSNAKSAIWYPADFIAEAIDQTRGWFYTLLAVATLLGKRKPYRAVISTGHVLDKNGKKMSKSLGNIVNPWDIVEKYGADAVRWYFYTINQPGDQKRFDESDVKTTMNRFVGTLWNAAVFYETYAPKERYKIPVRIRLRVNSLAGGQGTKYTQEAAQLTILDKWILSRLQGAISQVRTYMDNYDLTGAARALDAFVVEDFSNWYVRRSRDRFQRPKNKEDLATAVGVLAEVLHTTALLSAPFIPFLSEEIMRRLGAAASPHELPYPEHVEALRNAHLEQEMAAIRDSAALGHAARKTGKVRVRQPLAALVVSRAVLPNKGSQEELFGILADELNVKTIEVRETLPQGSSWVVAGDPAKVALDTAITKELALEGTLREIVRCVQALRRDAKFKPQQDIRVRLHMSDRIGQEMQTREQMIRKSVNARQILWGPPGDREKFKAVRTSDIDGNEVFVGIMP